MAKIIAQSPTSDFQKLSADYQKAVRYKGEVGRIDSLSESIIDNYLDMAVSFKIIEDDQLYTAAGYDSFAVFVKDRFSNFNDTLIKNLRLVADRCLEIRPGDGWNRYEVKKEFEGLSWSKIVELVSVSDDKEVVEILKDKPVAEIRKIKKEIKTEGRDPVIDRMKIIDSWFSNVMVALRSRYSEVADPVKLKFDYNDKYKIVLKSGDFDYCFYVTVYQDGFFIFDYSGSQQFHYNFSNFNLPEEDFYSNLDEFVKSLYEVKQKALESKKQDEEYRKLRKKILALPERPKSLCEDYEAYVNDPKNWKEVAFIPEASVYVLVFNHEGGYFVLSIEPLSDLRLISNSIYRKNVNGYLECVGFVNLVSLLRAEDEKKLDDFVSAKVKELGK